MVRLPRWRATQNAIAAPFTHFRSNRCDRYLAAVDGVNHIEDFLRVRKIGLGEDARNPLGFQSGNYFREPVRQHRRHAFEGLIEKQQFCAAHQCARQRHQFLLAAGKLQRLAAGLRDGGRALGVLVIVPGV